MANPLDVFRGDALAGHVAPIRVCGIAPGPIAGTHTLVVDGGHCISSPRLGMMS